MKNWLKLLLSVTMTIFISSCNDGLDGSSVTVGQMQITILKPYTNGTSLGNDTTIAGDCGVANYPIQITGDVSLYTVCQSDNTWSAAISGSGFTLGQTITVNAALKSPNYSSSSPLVTKTFTKADLACDDANNYTKVFANIDTADGSTNPYIICTAAQLSNINLYPSKKFKIGKNIDFGYANFNPIYQPFTGELDGQEFVLKNLNINASADSAVGLFKVVSGATVKNLKIADANITGNVRVGILAGDWRGAGTIQNVDVTGTVSGVQLVGGLVGLGNSSSALTISYVNIDVTVNSNDYAGGLISYVFADNTNLSITNSNIYANVTGKKYVGGVVGRIWNTTVANFDQVKHKGVINSTGQYVGGLVGEAYHGVTISNSEHVGSVTVPRNATNQDTNVGGLVGISRGTTNISDSHVVSNISMGGDYAGGLVGRYFGGSITNSYTRGSLNATDTFSSSINKFVGGVAGNVNTNSTLSGVSSHMTITSGAEYAGGLVGFLGGATTTIANSYSLGSMSAKKNFVGGLIGFFGGQSITNSFSKTNLTISSPTPLAYVGGIVGYVYNTAVFDSLYYSGDISISGGAADYVGGGFGYVKANSINKVFTTGTVVGARSNLGGIAGYLRAPLTSAMSSMSITGSLKNIGGIAGIALKENISNAFFTGSLTGDGNIGGIAGWYIPESTKISDSYSMGALYKIAGSSSANSSFGGVVGLGVVSDVETSYYNSLIFDQGAGSNINDSNGFGDSKTLSELALQGTYVGLDFASAWQMPNVGFTLPGSATQYDKAVLSWMTAANYGFATEQTFSDDPINETNPSIIPEFIISDSLALEFGQSEIDEIVSTTQASNVTIGNLEITIEKPAANNEQISGRMLVHGQCGVAGNTIAIGGAFNLRTVCQANNRWAAIVDSTSLSSGNLALSVDLKNSSLGTGSSVVTKTLVKGSSLCDATIANTGTYGNSHLGANGSSTPYIICNKGQFQNISLNPSLKFELGRDVDFSGSTTEPIAVDFTGTLDGKNFKLKNYTIDKPTTTGVGMFKAASGATLKDIQFINFNVNGYAQVGGVVGTWKGAGTISNVTISGILNGIQYTGGLIGVANTNSALNISNLTTSVNMIGNDFTGGVIGSINTATGSLTASDLTLNNNVTSNGVTGYVGGFIGELLEPNTTLTNITQTNNIVGHGLNVGGLIGLMAGGSINNCNVTGNITINIDGTDGFVGGIVGRSTASTTINTCTYAGTIHAGSDHVAGIIGFMNSGSIIGSSSSGQIDIDDQKLNVPRQFVAGIIGKSEEDVNVIMNNLSSSMNINAKASSVGGLVGHIYGTGSTLRNSNATGSVQGEVQFVGGLGGFFMGDIMEDSYATGTVTVNNPTPFTYAGGLLGYANSWNSAYKRLYSTGNVTATTGSADYVGGLIGFFRGGAMEDSYATGNVGGNAIRNSSGGLVGIMRGDLTGSYSAGTVTCKGGNCGGLIGYLLNSDVKNSFAVGNVEAANSAGGLVGFVNIAVGTNVIDGNYAAGVVSRSSGSSADLLKFGPMIAEEFNATSFDATKNYYISENANGSHNTSGSGIANASSSVTTSYPNFAFAHATDDWMSAPVGFEITPGVAYTRPIPDWRGGGGGGTTLFNISGTLSGLQYDTLKVTLNGSEELTLNPGETSFNFTTQVAENSVYTVIVSKHPSSPAIPCTISNNSGTAVADVTNVSVVCPTFTSIDLVALNNMATGASQNLTVNGTLSNSNVVDVTSYSTFTQSPVATFDITGNTLTANSDATATVTANFLSLSNGESVTSVSGASALRVIGTIANVQAGQTLASIQVEVIDGNGARVTSANSSITLSLQSNPSGATLSGTLTKSAVNGVITFDNLSLDKIGNGYTVKAASAGLTDAFTNAFDISAGAKASVAFVNQPAGANSNVAMNSFSVEVLDAGGNRVTSTETITLSLGVDPSSGAGTLGGTLSKQTVNGVVSFDNITIDFATIGYKLRATVSGVSPVDSSAFNIFAIATKLIVQTQPVNSLESTAMASFKVALSDDFNRVITNSSATVSLAFSHDPTSGVANLGGALSKAAVNGVVTFNDITVDRSAAGFTFIASSTGVTSVVTNSFDILITAPSTLSLIAPASSPSNIQTPTIRVDGLNSGDNVSIFANSACSGSSLASITASASTADLTTSALSEGAHTIYANRQNSSGQTSVCSASFVAYEVQNAFAQNDDMNSLGNWTNATGDNGDWAINSGDTPSVDVGPSSGTYAYTEASNAAASDVFILESNTLDGSANNLKFDFKWNKRGTDMGDLIVEASNDNGSNWTSIWSHTGSDIATAGADIWRDQSLDLCALNYNTANVKIRFRAVMPATGTVWNSDIGVDDLNFSAAGCTASASSVAFTTPTVGTDITAANYTSFTIGGTCSDEGQAVVISGGLSDSVNCTSGAWSKTLDFSSVGDGLVSLTVTHIASSGGQNGTVTRQFNKDSTTIQVDSFDTLGNWTNSTADNLDWAIISGETPSTGVGPSGGVNNSSYLYTEASSPAGKSDEFILESNVLNGAAHNLRIDFSWNKRGNSMGNLYLEASTDGGATWNSTLWSHLGADIASDGTSTWRNESVDVCGAGVQSANTKFRFRSVMPASGTVWHSDIGLDEVKVTNQGCTTGTPATIAITSPASGTVINAPNQASFAVSGTCSDHGQSIAFSGNASGATTCNLGSWTHTFDFTSLPDGNVSVIADHTSSTGGPTGRDTRAFVKDLSSSTIQLDEFNSFINWTNVAYDNHDWTIQSGDTKSNNVGPSGGDGGGNYIFTEASSPVNANEEFIVESNALDASSLNLVIDFKWNKRGDFMGDLFLEYSTDNGSTWTQAWSHLGVDVARAGVDLWRAESIDLCNMGINSANTKFRFRAKMPASGTIWHSDIGLDTIEFKNTGCN